jgi:hypothetical protein
MLGFSFDKMKKSGEQNRVHEVIRRSDMECLILYYASVLSGISLSSIACMYPFSLC